MRALLGTESVPVRRFAIAWTFVGGYVLGATGLLLFDRDNAILLLVAALPGLTSAIGVALATRRATERRTGRILVASTLAVMACPLAAGAFVALRTAASSSTGGEDAVGLLCIAGGITAVVCAPLGLAFGGVFAGVYWQLDQSRRLGRSALEQLWMRFGGASVAQGVIVLGVAAAMPTRFGPYPSVDLLVPLGAGALAFGAVTAARGVALAVRRRRFVARVRRGDLAGWAVLPRARFAATDELPELFGPGGAEVLVRQAPKVEGPFREADAMEPVARL